MKRIIKATTFFSLFVALLLSSCQVGGELNTNEQKAAALEGTFLLSHIQETDRNIALGLSSKAAVPSADLIAGVTIPASNVNVSNYPEQGQSSTYTIAAANVGANIYLVTVTTTYGGGWQDGVRKKTVESYYISSADATYSTADTIVDSSGATDPLYRLENSTEFKTKFISGTPLTSTRYETIVATKDSGVSYASFAAASLNFDWSYVPTAQASGVNWSSKVSYTQVLPAGQLSLDLLIDSNATTYYLDGVRYYTELGTASDHEASSLAIERVYEGQNQTGRLIAQMVTRTSYTRAGGVAGVSSVDSKATYYLSVGVPFIVTKSNLATSVPLP